MERHLCYPACSNMPRHVTCRKRNFQPRFGFRGRAAAGRGVDADGCTKYSYAAEFDAIGAFDVLEHIVDDEMVLRETNKALKSGGGLLLTVPQHQFLWSAADESARHVRRYSSRDLREKVERAGFKVIRMTSFVSFCYP